MGMSALVDEKVKAFAAEILADRFSANRMENGFLLVSIRSHPCVLLKIALRFLLAFLILLIGYRVKYNKLIPKYFLDIN
jgi:hypothetical protein